MAQITFRNSKLVYYGPHPCDQCGVDICKMGHEWGGSSFTYPAGPIYPNTEWHVHVCDQRDVRKRIASYATRRVREKFPDAQAVFSQSQGWMIVSGDSSLNLACAYPNENSMSYIGDEPTAWLEAKLVQFPDGDAQPQP